MGRQAIVARRGSSGHVSPKTEDMAAAAAPAELEAPARCANGRVLSYARKSASIGVTELSSSKLTQSASNLWYRSMSASVIRSVTRTSTPTHLIPGWNLAQNSVNSRSIASLVSGHPASLPVFQGTANSRWHLYGVPSGSSCSVFNHR